MNDHRSQISKLLQQHGPLTALEIAELGDIPVQVVHHALANARCQRPGLVFRIVGYRQVNYRGRHLCVFAAEAGEDLSRKAYNGTRKKLLRKEALKRYREKNGPEINARNQLYKAKREGREVVVNPWMQLAPKEVRSIMTRPLTVKEEE